MSHLAPVDGVLEEVVQEQVGELRVLLKRCLDVAQEHTETQRIREETCIYIMA